jgi:hypothetical protein
MLVALLVFLRSDVRWRGSVDLTSYHGSRTHLSSAKDAPTPRRVQGVTESDVIALREVGSLHHRYERRAA